MPRMNISQAAATAGVTPKMIRHYESLGLIPQAERTESGYRQYGERETAMLRFIRQSRSLGFSMQQIDALLTLWRNDGRESRDVKRLVQQQLDDLVQRQRELDQMRNTLESLVTRCHNDHSAQCSILDSLANAATPLPPAGPEGARKALKTVQPGEKRAPRARAAGRAPEAADPPAHAALSVWMRHAMHQA